MKTFVIYVHGHKKSEEYMQETIASCEGMGYDPIPFAGATQYTIKEWIKKFPFMKKDKAESRISDFYVNRGEASYLTKKACLANHIRIWTKCLELDETIVVLEHDARCSREWNDPEFDEFLILNPESGSQQPVFDYIQTKGQWRKGIHTYNQFLTYDYENSWINSWCPPGTASYAVKPSGAKRLLDTVKLHGCEQSDLIINTCTVRLQYGAPDYFTVAENLSMSKGF